MKFIQESNHESLQEFESELRSIRKSHMSFMMAILETEPFRFIAANEPLKTKDDDMIPEKFAK